MQLEQSLKLHVQKGAGAGNGGREGSAATFFPLEKKIQLARVKSKKQAPWHYKNRRCKFSKTKQDIKGIQTINKQKYFYQNW